WDVVIFRIPLQMSANRTPNTDGPMAFGYGVDATDSACKDQRCETDIGRSSPLAWKKSPRRETTKSPDAFPSIFPGCIWALTLRSHHATPRRRSMRPDRVQIEPARVTAGKSFSGSNTLLKKFVREYIATSATISMTFASVSLHRERLSNRRHRPCRGSR